MKTAHWDHKHNVHWPTSWVCATGLHWHCLMPTELHAVAPWHVHVLPLIKILFAFDSQLVTSDWWLKWTNYIKQQKSAQQALQQALWTATVGRMKKSASVKW